MDAQHRFPGIVSFLACFMFQLPTSSRIANLQTLLTKMKMVRMMRIAIEASGGGSTVSSVRKSYAEAEEMAFMEETRVLLLLFLCISATALVSADGHASHTVRGLARSKFPEDFFFGAASSAYQVEGAVKVDGRYPSTWDNFSHTKGKISDGSNGDVAVDHYHRFKGDIHLVKDMGMDVFRFSISWPRIYPNGSSRYGHVNQVAIDHYNKVINYTISNGIKPLVTIFHWDLPETLYDKYRGWIDEKILDDYVDFADVCFKEFGDRVKYWATLNEPQMYSNLGYDAGIHAPGRCSVPFGQDCKEGNSTTKPYLVAHNLLRAHSAAVKLYKKKYYATQKGQISIVLNINWGIPYSKNDYHAWRRCMEFNIGWFMRPLMQGDYPKVMRSLVKDRLPKFSETESADLKGSFDFIGINYYSTNYVIDNPHPGQPRDYNLDMHANMSFTVNNDTLGEEEGSEAFRSYPRGLREILNYFKVNFDNPSVYITETGYADTDNGTMPLRDALNDTRRVQYHQKHLENVLLAAKKDGCNIHGYTVWSLTDSFEWSNGYNLRYGLYYIDYHDNLRRHQRASGAWFKYFMSN